ncbi:carboxymuconolactone decarboxylase family protein [Marinoscillum sp.]|uniref:carboxymuconolactone decarboxylase family protein n=1 Tax=Marinoscillum sp. TaxID=2024838 RepID=UPI003BAC81E0
MSTKRIDIYQVQANYYTPLIELNNQLRRSSLELRELLLIYIRASQINGCAYCIQSHVKEAVELGEKQYRIHALSAWEDSPFFTEEEQVLLQLTEEVTSISLRGITQKTYARAQQLLDDSKITDTIMAITCINSWNRIGRATQLTPFKSQD